VDDKWSYKLSAGYFTQDALPRPTGSLPSGTPYPAFANTGASQPKSDARVEYDRTDGSRITIAGGAAGTEGIIHTGIGPFDVDSSSHLTPSVNVFVNYSYQWMPEIDDFPTGVTINDVNWPAENRFNAGFNFTYNKWLGNFAVSYTDEAYWQDVLDARFAGTTDAFTLVNGAIGYRWWNEKVVTTLKLTNIGNQEVQQHIFGDILRRQVVGEVRFNF
jgi:hypothetical protein